MFPVKMGLLQWMVKERGVQSSTLCVPTDDASAPSPPQSAGEFCMNNQPDYVVPSPGCQ